MILIEKIFQRRTFNAVAGVLIILLLITLVYRTLLGTRAARQHLKNELAVADKLEKGELTIKTKSNDDADPNK